MREFSSFLAITSTSVYSRTHLLRNCTTSVDREKLPTRDAGSLFMNDIVKFFGGVLIYDTNDEIC